MILELLGHDFGYKLEHIVRIFYVNEKILRVKEKYSGEEKAIITTQLNRFANKIELFVRVRINEFDKQIASTLGAKTNLKELERELSVGLFVLLREQTGKNSDWGILTGVRPVRMVQNLLDKGLTSEESGERLINSFLVSPQKTDLVLDTGNFQRAIINDIKENSCSLYISIPFCPTRCSYCSFVSHAIENTHKLLGDYLELLQLEIRETTRLIAELGLNIQSVYIGGGTPTILSANQLEQLLGCVSSCVATKGIDEFTLEAGRPDTITKEKLVVAKSFGVDRISINPQTLNPQILKEIGRDHTTKEFYSAFKMARDAGIPTINTDLIAGLPNETANSFIEGLNKIAEMDPENITIHALTIKKSSFIKTDKQKYVMIEELGKLLDLSREILENKGYFPYYLYRQKGTVQNQENVGYAKPETLSVYNIAMMEEVQTVFGVGAGATTRLLLPNNDIKRIYNFKYPYEYINRFDEIRERKGKARGYYERG